MQFRSLVLSVEGKAGHERQAIAVAQRVLPPQIVRLPRRGAAPEALPLDGVALVVAAGRQAIAPARRILERSPRPVVAVLQPVLWRPAGFDLIWSPRHDRRGLALLRARGENHMETLTTPSPLTEESIGAALNQHAPALSGCPRPRVAVLVGGPSRTHRFGALEADEFGARLAAFSRTHQASLIVATSPRTTPAVAQVLASRLAGLPHALFDYRTTPDPSSVYAAALGAASAIIATSDSIAMMSEAVATGKPLYGWRLPGGKAKYETFYDSLVAHGAMRWFDGRFDLWTYQPLDAANAIAAHLAPAVGLLTAQSGRK